MSNTGITTHYGMNEETYLPADARSRLHTLGILWVVYGVIRIAMAISFVFYGGTATVMFGALLDRTPNPFLLMDIFHAVYAAMVVLAGVCGLIALLAGLIQLASRRGRFLAIVAAFLALSDVPLGLTLGIYTLITLLDRTYPEGQIKSSREMHDSPYF